MTDASDAQIRSQIRSAVDLFARRPWRALTEADLAAAAAVPAMLRAEESQLYQWLASEWAQGAGEIVDLGCFVGGSTARLAEGHRRAGHPGLIHAYDRFTVSEKIKRRLLYPAGIEHFSGEDTLPLARDLLAPWADRVTFYRGEILARRWPAELIEILVLDASKSATVADHCAAEFFPALIPGRSIVVQQDFLHAIQPWLPAQMELLADCFVPLVHCPRDSLSYLCIRVPGAAELAAARTADLDDDRLCVLIEAAAQRLAAHCPAKAFEAQIARVRANPGRRVAWRLARRGT